MPLTSALFLLSTAAYAGFQWTVHVVVYPQFALVPPAAFVEYERRHQGRISIVVGPLFAALVIGTGGLVVGRPQGVGVWVAVVATVLAAVVVGVTAVVAVPLHRRLSAGWSADAHRALLRADLVRTLAATGLLAVGMFQAWPRG